MRILTQSFFHFLLFAIAFLISGCSNTVSEAKEDRQGRLLIWHPFQREFDEIQTIERTAQWDLY